MQGFDCFHGGYQARGYQDLINGNFLKKMLVQKAECVKHDCISKKIIVIILSRYCSLFSSLPYKLNTSKQIGTHSINSCVLLPCTEPYADDVRY